MKVSTDAMVLKILEQLIGRVCFAARRHHLVSMDELEVASLKIILLVNDFDTMVSGSK